jgi:hypothetical protein
MLLTHMTDLGSPEFQRTSIACKQAPWFERRYSMTLVVLVATSASLLNNRSTHGTF